jgi:putative peptidoglycan lipid II flippase
VGPFQGRGIAFALSVSSAINTLYLLIALGRSGIPGAKEAIFGSLRYFARILAFSAVAALPLYFLRPVFIDIFAFSSSRLVNAGLPLVLEALAFGAIGIALLGFSRDEVALSLARRFSRRARK